MNIRDLVLTIACPSCDATVGNPCGSTPAENLQLLILPGFGTLQRLHQARWDAARQVQQQDAERRQAAIEERKRRKALLRAHEFPWALEPDLLWSRVIRGAADECWPWTGPVDVRGYGRVTVPGRGGRYELVHRIAYGLTHGPTRLVVRHTCKTMECCNPAHLEATRSVVGKLTQDDANEIKVLLGAGRPKDEIAGAFDVAVQAIANIEAGVTWSADRKPPTPRKAEPRQQPTRVRAQKVAGPDAAGDEIDRGLLAPGVKVRICNGNAQAVGTIQSYVGGEGPTRRYLVKVGDEIRDYSRRTMRKFRGMRKATPQTIQVEVGTESHFEEPETHFEESDMSKSEDIHALLNSWSKPPANPNPIKFKIGAPEPPRLVYVNAERARKFLGLAPDADITEECTLVHPRNRDSTMRHIKFLANEIVSGRWMATHQGAALDKRRRALDSIHRFKAIILADQIMTANGKTGLYVPMWVFPGCSEKMFDYIDAGFNRNQQHRFIALGGERKHAREVCAIGRSMIRGVSTGNFKLTVKACVEASLEHQDLIRTILTECQNGKCHYYSNGWSGAFAKAALEFGEARILPILRKFVNQADLSQATPAFPAGAALSKGDPMKTLFDFLGAQKNSRNTEAGHVRDWMQYPFAVTAIRTALAGKELTSNALKSRTRDVMDVVMRDGSEKKRIHFKVEDFAKDFATAFSGPSKLDELKEAADNDDDDDDLGDLIEDDEAEPVAKKTKRSRAPKRFANNRELMAAGIID